MNTVSVLQFIKKWI